MRAVCLYRLFSVCVCVMRGARTGIFVSFVPQGLPATVTMLLTFAAMRLKDCNVLVKDLTAVDTLGTITLLASDKTGTLTVNRMTVVDAWINGMVLSTVGRGANQALGGKEEEVFLKCIYIYSRNMILLESGC